MSTGAVVGAAARRAERRLVEHLRKAGALSQSSASFLPDQSWMGRRVLHRLVAAGAIREVTPGYYLDEAVYSDYRGRRLRMMGLVVGPLVVVALLFIWWASHR